VWNDTGDYSRLSIGRILSRLIAVTSLMMKLLEHLERNCLCKSGFVQTLESPEIKMLRFPGMESPGKRHRSWKSPGILQSWSWKFYFLVQVSLDKKFIVIHWVHFVTSWVNSDFRNTFILLLNNLWPLLCLHRLAAILFYTICMCILESPWKRIFWVLENPEIWFLQVLENSVLISVRTLVGLHLLITAF